MQEAELPGLITTLLWGAFALGAAFGAVAQRTQFCTMGAVTDILNTGDWSRMRMWLLAMGVAMVGFNALVGMSWVQASHSVYADARLLWFSNLVGGLLFGFGMVLASGCGSKTLVRIGGGSLKSLVVFAVLAIAAYATLRGVAAVARVATVDQVAFTLPVGQDLPSLLAHASGGARTAWAWGLGLLLGGGLIAWVVSQPQGRSAEVLWAGLGIGALTVAAWALSGVAGHLSEHPVTLDEVWLATNTRRMESFTFVAPMAYTMDWLILFSDKSKVLTLGVTTVLGVVVGSALSAVLSGTFRWEGFVNTEDTAKHLVGAVLMGVGGVTAMGCTVGQGISGMSTLSLGSFIAFGGILLGGAAGLRYQIWQLERSL